MKACRFLRCPREAVYVAASSSGDLLDLCPDHAADGVEKGRFRWIIDGLAVWVRSDGLERDGDFVRVAS